MLSSFFFRLPFRTKLGAIVFTIFALGMILYTLISGYRDNVRRSNSFHEMNQKLSLMPVSVADSIKIRMTRWQDKSVDSVVVRDKQQVRDFLGLLRAKSFGNGKHGHPMSEGDEMTVYFNGYENLKLYVNFDDTNLLFFIPNIAMERAVSREDAYRNEEVMRFVDVWLGKTEMGKDN
jgi:hypothetical protein